MSVVGRPLTEEEQVRLEALTAAENDIECAITRLSPNGSMMAIALPPSGPCALGNGRLAVELRIDLDGSNIVSGDISAVAMGQEEWLGAFRSEPGAHAPDADIGRVLTTHHTMRSILLQ